MELSIVGLHVLYCDESRSGVSSIPVYSFPLMYRALPRPELYLADDLDIYV